MLDLRERSITVACLNLAYACIIGYDAPIEAYRANLESYYECDMPDGNKRTEKLQEQLSDDLAGIILKLSRG